jgi:Holliday junction resolvasome RuvABC DNA-binding subunit
MAILAGDEKALTIAPGIGKKIAQRVILELRDKIQKKRRLYRSSRLCRAFLFPGRTGS